MSAAAGDARPAYLDNAATTAVDPRVVRRMAECLTAEGDFGNPASAGHVFGERAAQLVEAARRQVADAAGARAADVVFTSGATEADNLAIFGVAELRREEGRHLVTVRTEHKAVLDPCRALERRGWRVTYLVPDGDGILDPRRVAEALRPDTVLVSVMHVNNEIGTVQDVAGIARACALHGRAWLHVDAAQSVGKCGLSFERDGIHLMSLSAHKAHGPKGVGALILARARGVLVEPRELGGGQELGLRSGTLATHQIVGMGEACALATAEGAADTARIAGLAERLWRGLEALGGVWRNGDPARSVPHIVNLSFEGVEGESLLAAVRPHLAVSTGSACASAIGEPSYVLRALGRSERLAESSLRFSLGRFTTREEVERGIAVVSAAVIRLRRIAGTSGCAGACA